MIKHKNWRARVARRVSRWLLIALLKHLFAPMPPVIPPENIGGMSQQGLSNRVPRVGGDEPRPRRVVRRHRELTPKTT